MALDFIGFIGENTPNLTPTQKVNLLNDFCESFSVDPIPVGDRRRLANEAIQAFIVGSINEVRRKRAAALVVYEKLVI